MEPHRILLDRDIQSPVHDVLLPFTGTTFDIEISSREAAVRISILMFTTGKIFFCTAHSMGQMLCCRGIRGVRSGGISFLAALVNTAIVSLPVLCD